MQVWLLLSCSCLYGGGEKYLFFDLPLAKSYYLANYPVLMSIRGSVTAFGAGTVDNTDFRPLFSETAFNELIQIAQNDFHNLPANLIQEILWKIAIISQDNRAQIGFSHSLIDLEPATFLIDTVESGNYSVKLFLGPYGELQTEVQELKDY